METCLKDGTRWGDPHRGKVAVPDVVVGRRVDLQRSGVRRVEPSTTRRSQRRFLLPPLRRNAGKTMKAKDVWRVDVVARAVAAVEGAGGCQRSTQCFECLLRPWVLLSCLGDEGAAAVDRDEELR